MLKSRKYGAITLPTVGVGTWAIGGPYWTNGEPTGWSGPLDDEDSIAALRIALANGLSHIDTADVYGLGRAERLVGQALQGTKEPYTLASKCGFVATSSQSPYLPENIIFQCEQSLRNCGVDCLDMWYFHHCDFGENDCFLEAAVATAEKLKAAGKIRSICLSGYSANDLIRVGTIVRPDFIQSWASFEHSEFITPGSPLESFMATQGIKFIAMMPYGQGRLLGKYSANNPPRFGDGDTRLGNTDFTDKSLSAIAPQLLKFKERFGEKPVDLITPALGFLLKHPIVASVIPGFRSSLQVRELISALEKPFSDEDFAFIKQLFPMAASTPHPWS